MDQNQEIERSIIKKFRPNIWRMFMRAIQTYDLIQKGDKIAVCISGGKDSMLLAKCMQELKRHGDVAFDLVFLAMDPGYSQKNRTLLEKNSQLLNIPLQIFETNIFDVVSSITESPCYLCARMRRGHLYATAKQYGCNKIALGHHFDDVIETTLMSMLYGAEMKTMMPKLHSENYPGMQLIRPLYMVKEAAIKAWVTFNDLHFLQCACKFTENRSFGNKEHASKRYEIKQLIKQLRTVYADIDINIFRSAHNVNLNTILGYHDDQKSYFFLDDYAQKK